MAIFPLDKVAHSVNYRGQYYTFHVSEQKTKKALIISSYILGCPKSTYSCDKGDKCLLLSSLCDGLSDCHDSTDEKNCPLNPGKYT